MHNDAENMKNVCNPGKWVLIWDKLVRAIQWIPTWQGLDGFQILLPPGALDECSLSIGRVKTIHSNTLLEFKIYPSRWCVAWLELQHALHIWLVMTDWLAQFIPNALHRKYGGKLIWQLRLIYLEFVIIMTHIFNVRLKELVLYNNYVKELNPIQYVYSLWDICQIVR